MYVILLEFFFNVKDIIVGNKVIIFVIWIFKLSFFLSWIKVDNKFEFFFKN